MRSAFAAVILLGLVAVGCDRKPSTSKLDPDIARFIAAKRVQTQQMPAAQTNGLPPTIWKVFDAAERGDLAGTSNLFKTLRAEAGYFSSATPPGPISRVWQGALQTLGLRPRYWAGLSTEAWSPVHEVIGITEIYQEWDHKWMRRFGRDIIDSIPSNSIYFGGTDGGRFIITALSELHTKGQPFFTLTQNQLADARYLDYLQTMYGSRIQTPTANDSQRAFQYYLQDAQRRKEANKLKPGENVQIVSGRVQVSGQTAVMEINGLLVYNIFTNNPDHEFYIEESFPLDWMYPHLSPHGLILKLNHEPLPELSDEIVRRDHEYWTRYTRELIGDWLTPDTKVGTVCHFATNTYLRKDLNGFKGDADFARDPNAQKAFGKLRGAIAGLYAWRAENAKTHPDKKRMNDAADFAFRQSLAIGVASAENAERYFDWLSSQSRTNEAALVSQLAAALSPSDPATIRMRMIKSNSSGPVNGRSY